MTDSTLMEAGTRVISDEKKKKDFIKLSSIVVSLQVNIRVTRE